ncbi:LysR family transcriptional regulator [Eggerthellaceae bacterium zg-887]|uniref:LysR family transcriptional regulator n=1 Tax=Xiamenia xianingshaonis TaxID=2682776 RepID=UPI00140D35A8|nr:LysR family transcriptional regulator [Xiamenia xianingshaonis]NHM16624.1 LysR family transcriptional regulator [Xiamenia xianingshaonis]
MLDNRVKTFMKAVDAGSFSRASKDLFISSVSIKKQMDSLESELGVQLLERTNRGVKPTVAGEIFYGSAARANQLSEHALRQIRGLSHQEKPTVKVGTSLLRPCSRFLDIWTRAGSSDEFSIEIVPFEDGEKLDKVIANLGNGIDCFLGPCDAPRWFKLCSVLKLGFYDCAIAVPRRHVLSKKSHLAWDDLEGQSLMLIEKGTSPVLDSLRSEIESRHPSINVVDTPTVYGIDTFNQCEREGIFMETLDVWRDVHPGFATLPMEWDYRIPYGLFYSKNPSDRMARFVDLLTEG